MLNKDFKEFIESLNSAGVEYLVVGGYALALHGRPRYTGDIDIWVHPSSQNLPRLIKALNQFGFGDVGLTEADFKQPEAVVQLGYPPARIDLLTTIDGVTFEVAFARRVEVTVGGTNLFVIHLNDLRANKQAAGRPQDLADLDALRDADPPE